MAVAASAQAGLMQGSCGLKRPDFVLAMAVVLGFVGACEGGKAGRRFILNPATARTPAQRASVPAASISSALMRWGWAPVRTALGSA